MLVLERSQAKYHICRIKGFYNSRPVILKVFILRMVHVRNYPNIVKKPAFLILLPPQ